MGKLEILKDMFSYRRPMGSKTEAEFVAKYVASLPGAERDEYGNWHVSVDDAPVLWSCHTDTVHRKEGRQKISLKRSGIMGLAKDELDSNCLGADDTAGVFLMHQMVLAKVPGSYVFHYGEEMGCVGSSQLAKGAAGFLKLFKFAIAFDRQGTADVITHQSYGRTASDAFALSLCDQLGGFYEPSDRGIYTDTNEYAALIPECTNVSVGYFNAHMAGEVLDTQHLFRLLAKLKKIDWTKLVCERDPTVDPWDDDDLLYDDGRDFIRRDFIEAEGVSRAYDDLLLESDDPLDREEYVDSLNAFLDPIWAEVQHELKRQLRGRTRPS